jgi:F-box/leucine-rich repeat protein 14
MSAETALTVSDLEDIRKLPSDAIALKGNSLGDAEVVEIASLRSLRELDLSGCEDLTDYSISALHRVSSLELLDLSFCNQITDSSLKALAALPVLRSINLNWCYGVTDDGLRSLGRCQSLESITLWSCELITDAGVSALASLPHLTVLDLPEFAHITDSALAALSANASNLLSLRLDHLSEISDRGLAQLHTLKRLHRLAVQSCSGISAEAVTALREALPECEISFKN